MNTPSPAMSAPWARALQAHRLGYPDNNVVRFLAGIPESPSGGRRRGVDVGFGSGQHLRALIDFGYETWGTELLEEEVLRQRALLGERLGGGRLLCGDLDLHPELKGRFDVALAWGVACLNRPSRLVPWLRAFGALLKPDGRACFDFRPKETWFHALGREIEPDCYLLDERAGPYQGAEFTFLDERGIRAAVEAAGLKLENLERLDWRKKNLAERQCWWIVWAGRKEGAGK